MRRRVVGQHLFSFVFASIGEISSNWVPGSLTIHHALCNFNKAIFSTHGSMGSLLFVCGVNQPLIKLLSQPIDMRLSIPCSRVLSQTQRRPISSVTWRNLRTQTRRLVEMMMTMKRMSPMMTNRLVRMVQLPVVLQATAITDDHKCTDNMLF